MHRKVSIIISIILVTAAAILTVQSSSMLQNSYAQLCPDGSTPDASGNCPTLTTPADDEETAEAPPAGDGETTETPPATTETPPPATEAPPPATTETPPPVQAPTPTPIPGGIPQHSSAPLAQNSTLPQGDFVEKLLEIHNRERALVNVPPLTWNDHLAADAQAYADYLIASGKFEHPTQEWVDAHPTVQEGENLAGYSGSNANAINHAEMAEGWVSEKSNYRGQPIPAVFDPSAPVTGHYTQMVWKSTTEFGCASATSSTNDRVVLSCRYTPPGNYIGQAPY